MVELKKNAWLSFKNLVKNFLRNKELNQNCQEIILKLKTFGCNMSIKFHFLHSHLANFPNRVNNKQGEYFLQEFNVMEEQY